MANPFEVLGLRPGATADEVRTAYRNLAKKNHPDLFQDAERKEQAHTRLVALNLAYEQAIKLAGSSTGTPYSYELAPDEAKKLYRRAMEQGNKTGALRQLLRTESRDAEWYAMQGTVLMEMEQFESAAQAYREAVRRSPDELEYRRSALAA